MNNIISCNIETPIGNMLAGATDKGICLLEFNDKPDRIDKHRKHFNADIEPSNSNYLEQVKTQLTEYFDKKLTTFTVSIDLIGTDFQIKVWKALLEIPYGITRTYKEQSIVVGNLKSHKSSSYCQWQQSCFHNSTLPQSNR